MPLSWLLPLGIVIVSSAPLLTSARLFQLKEWRWDRMREHLRREGPLRMYIGLIRRLRPPVWTAKALVLCGTSMLLSGVLAWITVAMRSPVFAVLLYPLQPFILLLSWTLWKPIDWIFKKRMMDRAMRHRHTLGDATVIGVVGSVGKTTVKELLACVLQDLSPLTTPKHVNTELGVAAWLSTIVAQSPLLIVEMGAYRAGEIATLCHIAQPTIGVVTALGSDHLALFGSEDAIVDANAEILATLPADGHVFLLGDNNRTKALQKRVACTVTIAGSADANQIRETDRGLMIESQGTRFNVALHGMHNAGNTLLAVAVARSMGIKDERIRELLAGFRGSSHTFHLKKERGVLILDDTYNVSPLSFRAALDWAKNRPERPRVLLTSGLLETGSAEERFLQELGKAAKQSVERVVFTTDAGRRTFATGFGKTVELLSALSEPVPEDGLLLCVGRMSADVIHHLLP